jgi:predicted AAA+ superfamily ATPase
MKVERFLKIDLPEGQSCFLWGARKTGKSTYLKETFPNAYTINLLEADIFRKYYHQPERLRQELEADPSISLVIIDEVQKIPLLLDEIHYLLETYKKITFILCGSSVRRLKSTGANLLGGRAWRYLFHPFCYPELKELNWEKIFNKGLIPNHYLNQSQDHTNKALASYLYDYILPEVQFEANLRNRDSFARFLDLIGLSNGEMIVYSNIARDCGIDAKTVKTYFEILEDMYLGYYLMPFRNQSKRQTISETPKFYFFDTGLANYLRRYTYTSMEGVEAGKAFEHYVFLELKAFQNLNEKRDPITYWRTKDGYEVDFIFQQYAVEVKLSDSIQKQHLKGLLKLGKEHSFSLNIVCLENKKRIITMNEQHITIWPIKDFLEALWNNTLWI